MTDTNCQIIIVPPKEERFDDPSFQGHICTELQREFPGFTFTIATDSLLRDGDRFAVMANSASPPLMRPSIEVILEVTRALTRFMEKKTTRH